MIKLFHQLNPLNHSRIVSKGGHLVVAYLCFSTFLRTNKLKVFPYSQYQKNLLSIIDSLRDNGFSYKRITKYFNNNKIKTPRGNTWGVTGNSVKTMLITLTLNNQSKELSTSVLVTSNFSLFFIQLKLVCHLLHHK